MVSPFTRPFDGLKRFAADRGGNTALIFALSAFPLLLAMGLAVDTSRAVHHRTKLANALDAAGLAAGASFFESENELEDIAEHYLAANLGAEIYALTHDLDVSKMDETLHLSIKMDVPTLFMGLVDIDSTPMDVAADIVRKNKKLEVALVLDNTGSMAGDKIDSLRDASEDLIGILFGDETQHPLLHVAIVPYVTAVNVKSGSFKDSWIDWYADSAHQGENFDELDDDGIEYLADYFDVADSGDSVSFNAGGRTYDLSEGDRIPHSLLFWFMEQEKDEAVWKGCVEARPAPYDVQDDAPASAIPDTLFTPYLWPDEPRDTGGSNTDYDNNYIVDDEDHGSGDSDEDDKEWGDSPQEQQRNFRKYAEEPADIDHSPLATDGPNKSCARPITPLTNDRDDLLDEIGEMEAWNDGGTNGAAGMSWGWRVLSPGEPYTEGAAYDDKDVEKVMIMMTDGENQIHSTGDNHNNAHYSSYGYLAKNRLGVTDRYSARGKINDRMETLCTNIKAQGITMYTVTFRQNSSALKQLYRDCATSDDHYFDSTSNGELEQHFQTIARQLSELRVAR